MEGKLSDDILATGEGREPCPSAYDGYWGLSPGVAPIEGDGCVAEYGLAWCELESGWDIV